jgi:hypothetical protein
MGLTTTKLTRLRPYADESSLERLGGYQINWAAVTAVNGVKQVKAGAVVGTTAGNLLTPRSATIAIAALAIVGTTATATSVAHGLIVGDRITISGVTTPSWANGTYLVATKTDDAFTFAVAGGASNPDAKAVTLTIATDLVGLTAHGLIVGDLVEFEAIATTTGLTAGTNYYVIAGGFTADVFKVSATAGGDAIDLDTGNGTALLRKVAGGSYTATGTVVTSRSAIGILETDANETSVVEALSGYSLLVGGVVYDNLLPDAAGSPKAVPAAYKAELAAAGCTFKYATYADSRS